MSVLTPSEFRALRLLTDEWAPSPWPTKSRGRTLVGILVSLGYAEKHEGFPSTYRRTAAGRALLAKEDV